MEPENLRVGRAAPQRKTEMLFPEEGILDPKQAKTTHIPLGEGREGYLRAGVSETFPRAGRVRELRM